MERNLLSDLYNWKLSSTRKPLILEGARQVGKTMFFERRKYLNELISLEGNGMIKIVTGIRRCGKSFLL